jgi:hypothetical protein
MKQSDLCRASEIDMFFLDIVFLFKPNCCHELNKAMFDKHFLHVKQLHSRHNQQMKTQERYIF